MKRIKITILNICILVSLVNLNLYCCTGISAAKGDTVLFGNNEDWQNTHTFYWIEPSQPGKYGGIYFGYNDFYAQGGMNEKGLCFDGFSTPYLKVDHSGRPSYDKSIMEECATVAEVVEVFKNYDMSWMSPCQFMYVDKTGASAIFEGDSIVYKEGDYQICTNFYQSNPSLGGYPCWRYNKAKSMFETNFEVSVEFFRSVLKATHQEGNYPTQYSNIYDLKNGIVYLYHFHNFDNAIIIDLAKAMANGATTCSIPDLFVSNVDENKDSVTGFQLSQNYPNPFNPVTQIEFSISKESTVKILVYDVKGKLVDELLNQNLPSGNHSVIWDATGQPSGIYFIKFNTDKYQQTCKCTLLK